MLPACVGISAAAMFSGISGAALLTPLFLVGFPLLGVPPLTTVQAIGTALLLQTAGFGVGVYRYLRMGLADLSTVRTLSWLAVPSGALGAVAARHAPAQALRLGYATAMLVLAWLLSRAPAPPMASGPESIEPCPEARDREIVTASGRSFRYCAEGLGLQRVFSALGAFLSGLISTGVGEATVTGLIGRSRFPTPVAAATSTLIVAATVVGAAAVHVAQLVARDGMRSIPWNLVVWAVPGAVVGAQLGTRLHGRVSERASRRFFSLLFLAIGVTFFIAFTLFRDRFAH